MAGNIDIYEFAEFHLDSNKQRLLRADEIIPLPPKAIELLVLLVENQGEILEKEDIINTLWSDTIVEDSNLTQTIYLLRKALGKTTDGGDFINTLPKRGYKFVQPVRKLPDSGASVTLTRTTQEQIFYSKEETETIHAELFAPSETVSETIPVNQNLTIKKSEPANFKKIYLILAVVIICAVGVVAFSLLNGKNIANQSNTVNSVAVVPFNVIGAEDKEGYLSLGLADTLITRLGQSEKIKIYSTEDIHRYSNLIKDPLEVGRKLQADAVLTGNLQRLNNRVRFNAQLLRVSDGKILWSNQFDEESADLFALQDSITNRVQEALTLELNPDEQKAAAKKATNNPEALKLYWQGRYYWNKRTPEWIQKGIEYFEKAIELDPNFAQAYAGLADSFALNVSGLPPDERFPKAKAAANKALELNENLAEAHTSLAFVTYKSEPDLEKAEYHFKRAIELNDSYATARHWYGEFLVLTGRFDEGLKHLQSAEQLDPFSISIKTDLGEALYRAARLDEAASQIGKVLEFDPNHTQAYRILRHIYEKKAPENVEVIKTDLKIQILSGVSPEIISEFQQIYDSKGWKSYWEKRLETLSDSPTNEYFLEKTEIYILLGMNEKAVGELEKKIKFFSITPLLLKGEPLFEPLYSNPRFKKLSR